MTWVDIRRKTTELTKFGDTMSFRSFTDTKGYQRASIGLGQCFTGQRFHLMVGTGDHYGMLRISKTDQGGRKVTGAGTLVVSWPQLGYRMAEMKQRTVCPIEWSGDRTVGVITLPPDVLQEEGKVA